MVLMRAEVFSNGNLFHRGRMRSHGLGTSIMYLRRTTSDAACNGLSRCQGFLMYPFTTSAQRSTCLVRASSANKQTSAAEGWGLGAQCLCVEPELPSYVHKQHSHQNTSSFASAAQHNIPISKIKRQA
jgi:hypothetical protein